MTDPAEEHLGATFLHGAEWFDELFTTYAGAVHRYFVRRTSPSEADDLTADVLATAWRRRQTITDGFELPWLYRTAGFVLANHRRRRAAVPVADIQAVARDDIHSGDDPASTTVEAARARAALASLAERDREILMFVAWDGVDRGQLAQLLGMSIGGADAALSRARARLRAAWDESA